MEEVLENKEKINNNNENNNNTDDENNKKKKKKGAKYIISRIAIAVASLLGVIILIVGGYVSYVLIQYYRIEDNLILNINNNQNNLVELNNEYSYTTLNMGFGAYGPDFDFFMDTGVYKDGTKTVGHSSKAKDKESVIYNTNGMINALKTLDSTFIALQEVDTPSDRSRKVNQVEMVTQGLASYANTYAVNSHSAYLAYPIFDNIGTMNSGLLTLSKFKINDSVRKSYLVDNSFPTKFFDLDRCFSVNRFKIKDSTKELVLINSHMSAYDEGGKVRNTQLNQLFEFMSGERTKGNYIIAAGDFNHDLVINNPNIDPLITSNIFPTTQSEPDWLSYMFDEDGNCIFNDESGFNIFAAYNKPTLRGADIPYTKDETYTCVVDGFIVSNNITDIKVENTSLSYENTDDFAFSDHQISTFTFKLN